MVKGAADRFLLFLALASVVGLGVYFAWNLGEAPAERFDAHPRLTVYLDPKQPAEGPFPGGTPSGYTVVFSPEDAERHGFPVENPMFDSVTGLPSAVMEMTAYFTEIPEEEPHIVLGCYGPIEIRDDESGTVALIVTDYCPLDGNRNWSLNVIGVTDDDAELGWQYNSKEGPIRAFVDEGGNERE